ncbi:putative universal stress protein [Methanocella paludicola SANAE]|uniref:Universal stress protein n=1 Tax=Methanocella paludicola (strain DSM 17711 / JCM 13418 / NBRC 101707 / SANAE) TaxID=304371 RepID=D1YZZ8_METPS|nr:universal stress protein [Methanocella paludicola]BAI62020.1 putative universal stress protein [Methanocella paludicola SANAE]
MYKKILIPVDDQEQSYAAVRVAGMMAACDKAGITLFHVRKPPMEVVTDIVTKDKLFELPLQDQDRRMFEKCMGILSMFGIEPKVKLTVTENVAAEILKECGTGAYDVIVMGHRGRKALKQLMLGSVANGVLTESKCPVIMVHVPKPGE